MHRKILFSMVLFLSSPLLWAADIQLNPAHPQSYTVVKGDTLWDIAGRFLAHPWQWPEVWEVNPQIRNPNLIYPGDEITLSERDGKPVLSLRRLSERHIKLTPTVRESARDTPIPVIPLDAINQFLSRPLVLTKAQIDRAPYVVGALDGHLVVGGDSRIYVRGLTEAHGHKLSIFRPGRPYIDPATGRNLGFEALHIGDMELVEAGETSAGLVTWTNREILKGDRLLPQEEQEYPAFLPKAPATAIDGMIMSVVDGVTQIGQHKVVVVNKGSADGLAIGDVLAIFQRGQEIADPIGSEMAVYEHRDRMREATAQNPSAVGRFFDRIADTVRDAKLATDDALGEPIGGPPGKIRLPAERAGELMIFRTFENLSYGLVMSTQRPVHVEDQVRNP